MNLQSTITAAAAPYMPGFGNHVSTEAVPGALPVGRNSPQKPPFGLYAEQLSGSSFTSPRHENRRSWLYRMRPTADHRPFTAYDGARLFGMPAARVPLAPNRLRWDPPADLPEGTDFVELMLYSELPAPDQRGTSHHLCLEVADLEKAKAILEKRAAG